MTSQENLFLASANLTGPIPSQLGTLASLRGLELDSNQLTGAIPSQLGNLANLRYLILHRNRLAGPIPTQLGALTSLQFLNLASNQLVGAVPGSMTSLPHVDPGNLDLRWNGLYSTDPTVVAFLDGKQDGGDWQSTQTIAPAGLAAGSPTSTSLTLTWTPIAYTADSGGYHVYSATSSGGPYTELGTTADKSASSIEVTGLTPGRTYHFVVKTVTEPHVHNQGTVTSEPGGEATGKTTGTGLRGDANGDGSLTVPDVFHLINFLFAGGPAPVGEGDANSDAAVTVTDVFFLINYLFAGGPAPA